MQPLTPAWRRVLDSGGASRTVLESRRRPAEPVESLATLQRWLAPTQPPQRLTYGAAAAGMAARTATESDPAAADAVVAAVTAALARSRGRRRRLRAVRLGRVHYSMDHREELLYYTRANAEVLERLLPPLAAAAPDTFVADGWVIRVLGRGGQRLSAGRLRTLRLRRAIAEDIPSHWALATVLRLHGAELEDVTLGLEIEPYTLLSPLHEHGYTQEHWPTGYLAHWLGAAGEGGARPLSPPPPPWTPPPSAAPTPVALPALRLISFLGSVSAADAAALVAAAPALTNVRLIGAVGTGALAALAPPALPRLDVLELFTAHRPEVLREELPLALARRSRLSLLRLPVGPDCLLASLAAGMVGAPWGGAALGEAAAWATELVAAASAGTWTAHDADVDRLVGRPAASAGDRDARPCAALGCAAPAVAPNASAGLRSLSIYLGADATDGAVAALATLPGLATLRLRLDGAQRVRLAGGWPPFPALAALALTLGEHPTRGGPSAAAALAALSAPRSCAPARLVHLHVRVVALSGAEPPAPPTPPPPPADEVGGWVTPPPDVAALAAWTALRTLVWDSLVCGKGAAAAGGGGDAAAAAAAAAAEAAAAVTVAAKAATARRVAATLPNVATCVRSLLSPDPWAPTGPHDVEPWHLYPDGGEPPGGEAAYLNA